jgi:hypothetical protein
MYTLVSAEHQSSLKLSAKDWCDSCIATLGKGRGGGKADLANANVTVDAATETTTTLTNALLAAANKYLSEKGAQ